MILPHEGVIKVSGAKNFFQFFLSDLACIPSRNKNTTSNTPLIYFILLCFQVHFPARALTKEICVGLSVFPVPASELGTQAGAASPVVTVEPRRRKFHRPITVTMPLPQTSGSRHTANIETSLLVSHILVHYCCYDIFELFE